MALERKEFPGFAKVTHPKILGISTISFQLKTLLSKKGIILVLSTRDCAESPTVVP